MHAENLLGQRFVLQLQRFAEQRGRDLGVEQRVGELAADAIEDLEVLADAVQDLDPVGIGHPRRQRFPEFPIVAQRERVEQPDGLPVADLDQARLREKGALTHELGVEAECRYAV